MKRLFALLPLIAVLAFNTGCVRGTLNPQGVYKSDTFLYNTDFYISSSHTTVRSFLSWELQNRGNVPAEITMYADKIRVEAPRAFGSAVALRDAYQLNPSETNRTALQQALDVLRQAVVESTKYLTQATAKPQIPTTITVTQ